MEVETRSETLSGLKSSPTDTHPVSETGHPEEAGVRDRGGGKSGFKDELLPAGEEGGVE